MTCQRPGSQTGELILSVPVPAPPLQPIHIDPAAERSEYFFPGEDFISSFER